MRWLHLCFVALIWLVFAGCSSQEKPKDEELDFFERLAKKQEDREMGRRDEELARMRGKAAKKKTPGDGTLEYYARTKDASVPGEPIKVTWEGLAREREIAADSKYNRPGTVRAPMKITLVSESHPEAPGLRSGRTKEGREASSSSAVLRDADLLKLVEGLNRRGYFQHASPTQGQTANFDHPRARGRVTIERNGQSVTLISMRGQGTNPRTEKIPGIYSDAKRAIMTMRNQTPGLALSNVSTDSILPGFGN